MSPGWLWRKLPYDLAGVRSWDASELKVPVGAWMLVERVEVAIQGLVSWRTVNSVNWVK